MLLQSLYTPRGKVPRRIFYKFEALTMIETHQKGMYLRFKGRSIPWKCHPIDFASRFPPRQLEARGFGAKILELGIESMKIESGACDLPPEGSKKKSYRN